MSSASTSPLVSAEELLNTPVVRPPRAGSDWQGVNHGVLINAIIKTMENCGHPQANKSPRFFLARDGADLAATIYFNGIVGGWHGLTGSLGIVASNSRRLGLRLYAGVVTRDGVPIVTDSFGGMDQKNRPHWQYTIDFNPAMIVLDAIDWWRQKVREGQTTARDLRGSAIPHDEDGRYLITQVGGILPWSRVGIALRAWDERKLLSGEKMDSTKWGIYRLFTELVTKSPPTSQMNQLIAIKDCLLGKQSDKEVRTA